MERYISKDTQARDASLFIGGVVAIIGLIAENKILSENNVNFDAAIVAGGTTLTGAALSAVGTLRYKFQKDLQQKTRE